MAQPPESAIEPTFDLEAYISRYAPGSETRLQRLVFIAQHDPANKQLALDLLERQLQESGNVTRYQQVFQGNDDTTTNQYNADWVRTATATNEAALEVLEGRLSAAQSQLNKDAIRMCYLKLGDFHLRVGQVREALRHVLRSRDYCTNRTQAGHVCWKVIELAMNTSNWAQVRDYISKAEHSLVTGDVTVPRKLKVAAGMALLGEGHFQEAAEKFAQVKVPPDDMGTLTCPEDVALYSSLLALATLDRSQLVHYLEEQPTILELVPPVRDVLRNYVRAQYKACLQMPLGRLDLYLSPHADKLVQQIRNRSLVDYLRPYRKVHLPQMAQVFGESTENLKRALAELIGKGDIPHARIDCRTLTLERADAQAVEQVRLSKTQERVQHLQETVLNDAYASIIRLACMENDSSGTVFRQSPQDLEVSSDEDADITMVDMVNPEDLY